MQNFTFQFCPNSIDRTKHLYSECCQQQPLAWLSVRKAAKPPSISNQLAILVSESRISMQEQWHEHELLIGSSEYISRYCNSNCFTNITWTGNNRSNVTKRSDNSAPNDQLYSHCDLLVGAYCRIEHTGWNWTGPYRP